MRPQGPRVCCLEGLPQPGSGKSTLPSLQHGEGRDALSEGWGTDHKSIFRSIESNIFNKVRKQSDNKMRAILGARGRHTYVPKEN